MADSHQDPKTETTLAPADGAAALERQIARPGSESSRPLLLSSPPNLKGLLECFLDRWVLATVLVLVAAPPVAAGIWFLWPSNVVARTQLHVAATRPIIMAETPEIRSDFGNYQRTQLALIRSRLVLNAALNDKTVTGLKVIRDKVDPIEWLESQVTANFSRAPEILEISMTGADPNELKTLVNAIREAYLKEVVNKEQNVRLTRLDHLKKLFAEYEGILRDKQRTLRTLAEDLGSRNAKLLAIKQEFSLRELNSIQNELLSLQSKIRETKLQAQLDERMEKEAEMQKVSEKDVEDQVNKDPVLVRLIAERDSSERLVQAIKNTSRRPEDDAAYANAIASVKEFEKQISLRKQELRPLLAQQLIAGMKHEAKSRRHQAQERLALLETLDQNLQNELKVRTEQTQEFGKKAINLEWLHDEIVQADEITKKVAAQVATLQIELQAPPRVTLLEDAVVSRPRDRRAFLAAGAALAVAGVLCLGIAWFEFRKRKVKGSEEIVYGLKINVIGTLPLYGKSGDGTFFDGCFYEAVENARTMLLHSDVCANARIIMITSAVGGEGKTFLASHLAMSLARSGHRTILVDCDLRRSSIRKRFELTCQKGLSELIKGDNDYRHFVEKGPVENLTILHSGRSDTAAIQALKNGVFGRLCAQLRRDFDYVIIDSAPVLPVADAQMIAQHADGVIFSIIRSVSQLNLVYDAYERLTALRCRILGAIVHGVARGPHQAGYSYGEALAEASTDGKS